MNGEPILAGVVGYPIGHSRSPLLHGYWLRKYGISGHYVPVSLSPDRLVEGLRALGVAGFRGVNVTIPFKELALSNAATVSETAGMLGAANTLTFESDGSYHADNTDGYGFLSNMRQTLPDWTVARGTALILGAGGAARAVVGALLSEGIAEIRLANRTRRRAEELRDHFGTRVRVIDWREISEAVCDVDTVINTTSLGMIGNAAIEISLEDAESGTVVTDLVYQPLITPLLAQAQSHGLPVVDGLGMLLHQGAPGFERWYGHWPEVDADLRRAVLGR